MSATLDAARRCDAGWLVLGWPLEPSGGEGWMCTRVLDLVAGIRAERCYLPILLWDERSSTALAREAGRQSLAESASRRAAVNPRDSELTRALRVRQALKRALPPEKEAHIDADAATVILDSLLTSARAAAGIEEPP